MCPTIWALGPRIRGLFHVLPLFKRDYNRTMGVPSELDVDLFIPVFSVVHILEKTRIFFGWHRLVETIHSEIVDTINGILDRHAEKNNPV
jgi:hypothetical protein